MKWTEEEDAILRRDWVDVGPSALANGALKHRTLNSIIGRAHRLELPKTDPSISSRRAWASHRQGTKHERPAVALPRNTLFLPPAAPARSGDPAALAAAALLSNARKAEGARNGYRESYRRGR